MNQELICSVLWLWFTKVEPTPHTCRIINVRADFISLFIINFYVGFFFFLFSLAFFFTSDVPASMSTRGSLVKFILLLFHFFFFCTVFFSHTTVSRFFTIHARIEYFVRVTVRYTVAFRFSNALRRIREENVFRRISICAAHRDVRLTIYTSRQFWV